MAKEYKLPSRSASLQKVVLSLLLFFLTIYVLPQLSTKLSDLALIPSPLPTVVPTVSPSPLPTPTVPVVRPGDLQASGSAQQASSSAYLVSRVIDGDTIEIMMNNKKTKVRLIGVDTPETVDPRRSVQCFGKQASDFTKALLMNAQVTLEKDVSETDKYGRLLRYVYKDGENINFALLNQGFAHAKSYPPDVKYQNQFKEAEATARTQKKGLWADDACLGK